MFSLDERSAPRDGGNSEELRQRLGPEVPLAWLIGGDSLDGLMRWHRWQQLFALAHIVVVRDEERG